MVVSRGKGRSVDDLPAVAGARLYWRMGRRCGVSGM